MKKFWYIILILVAILGTVFVGIDKDTTIEKVFGIFSPLVAFKDRDAIYVNNQKYGIISKPVVKSSDVYIFPEIINAERFNDYLRNASGTPVFKFRRQTYQALQAGGFDGLFSSSKTGSKTGVLYNIVAKKIP